MINEIEEYNEELKVSISEKTAKKVLDMINLLMYCPPTIRQVLNAGDKAINAAGLNPWCVKEGLAIGNEKVGLWEISDCIKELEKVLDETIKT